MAFHGCDMDRGATSLVLSRRIRPGLQRLANIGHRAVGRAAEQLVQAHAGGKILNILPKLSVFAS